jgi:hypothetical protein
MSRTRKLWMVAVGVATGLLVVVAVAAALAGSPSANRAKPPANRPLGVPSPVETVGSLPPGAVTSAGGAAEPGAPTGSLQSGALHASASGSVPATGAPMRAPQSATSAVDAAAMSVTATKVVKTGTIDLRVAGRDVSATVDRLLGITSGAHGYVESSSTFSEAGVPAANVTIRIPVTSFDPVVASVSRLGHVQSLTTSAQDVTGRVVDLSARIHALQQTRSTYLTILSHATTIGATLAVQQRVDDAQQQIEVLQGELKTLQNQAAYSTLTVAISAPGAPVPVHHQRTGLAKAWHTSVKRFASGVEAIIGALGPILLVLLVLGVLALIAHLGYRSVRRATSSG